ncbi:AAA family ATPase [Burkholderia ubonensis]|uniref:AAA family ATPase n=1 Tax=Burkholderia ubonensis TaxID=101571 RepID=UPI0008FDDCD0|nr:ATP-binding protein [Burkholderia ubonensis]
MQKILVKDFSCIKMATLELSSLTIIIGPQASGKSVLSKLVYFCTNLISNIDRFVIEDQLNFESFSKRVALQFREWFPVSAWGEKRFSIEFSLGDFDVKINRIGKSEKIRLTFCPQFIEFYTNTYSQYQAVLKKAEGKADPYDFELVYKLRNSATNNLRKWLGNAMTDIQVFIPAGRSFFTSIGKALVAFEHSGILDPVTLEFGRRFSSIRERTVRRITNPTIEPHSLASVLFSEILGGHVKTESGKEYIQTPDGRLIPFSALSSGQQELLPLAVTIRSMLPSITPRSPAVAGGGRILRRTVYIEEPEAHLFPRAQNKLVEVLAALVARRKHTNLLLTTHSPYVLSKFNNLIKAGSLARPSKPSTNKELARIIPETAWLAPQSVNAYAIIEGRLENIMDPSGLIAADYLDDVSGDIAREFSQLLAIEVSR